MKVWNANMRISPQRFKNSMLYGLKPELVSVDMVGDSLFFNAHLGGPSEIIRQFDFKNKTVSHDYFKLVNQGEGTAKRVLLNQVALYKELDFREVTIHANIDIGGYAWAKYSFVPTVQSWQNLRRYLADKLERLVATNSGITQVVNEGVLEILSNDNPRMIWTLAGLEHKINGIPIGKLLLLGSDWHGTLDLLDEETMKRFLDYVK